MIYEVIYSHFQAEIKFHIAPIQTKNDAQTTSKQHQKSISKRPKKNYSFGHEKVKIPLSKAEIYLKILLTDGIFQALELHFT